jgi:hypothetical protein
MITCTSPGAARTTSRPDPRFSRKSTIAGTKRFAFSAGEPFLGGLGRNDRKTVHFQEFRQRPPCRYIVFDESTCRSGLPERTTHELYVKDGAARVFTCAARHNAFDDHTAPGSVVEHVTFYRTNRSRAGPRFANFRTISRVSKIARDREFVSDISPTIGEQFDESNVTGTIAGPVHVHRGVRRLGAERGARARR